MIAAPAHLDAQREKAIFDRCREITRRRARNFYYGLKLSPEPQRSALYAVYAWMRRVDDAVDGAGNDSVTAQRTIETLRAQTDAALSGAPVDDDPLWTALAVTAARFNLPREQFHAMLDGQLEDSGPVRYATFAELRAYCMQVASTVGLICIEIWGYRDEAAKDLAIERGIAFQLTNILRDYRQDYDAGRVYLPGEDFARFGIDPAALRRWEPAGPCREMIDAQVRRARVHYERSVALEGMIDRRFRATSWAMTSIYRALLEKMARDPAGIVSPRRVRLSAWRKALIAARAKFGAPHASATV